MPGRSRHAYSARMPLTSSSTATIATRMAGVCSVIVTQSIDLSLILFPPLLTG